MRVKTKETLVVLHYQELDNKKIFCCIQKKKGVKRLILKVNRQGEVKLTLPDFINIQKGKEFLESKKNWILNHVLKKEEEKKQSLANLFLEENQIFYYGVLTKVEICYYDFLKKTKLVQHFHQQEKSFSLNLPLSYKNQPSFIIEGLKKELQKLAKTQLNQLFQKVSKKIAISYQKLTIRNMVSRWGSCSAKGNISLLWRLIMAPQEIIEYVMIHELCHCYELNHSKEFWAWVEKFCPSWKEYRAWLKNQGSLLFSL